MALGALTSWLIVTGLSHYQPTWNITQIDSSRIRNNGSAINISITSTTPLPIPSWIEMQDCKHPGFYADIEDCTRFYRCAEHESGKRSSSLLLKFTFYCAPGTIFDDARKICDFPEMVEHIRGKCDLYVMEDINNHYHPLYPPIPNLIPDFLDYAWAQPQPDQNDALDIENPEFHIYI